MPQVKHVVLVRFKPAVTQAKIGELFAALARLPQVIPGIVDFSWGPYSSSEGLNQGFSHGFATTFADAASRDAYLVHPEHDQVKMLFLPELAGGVEGVIAFDWIVTE